MGLNMHNWRRLPRRHRQRNAQRAGLCSGATVDDNEDNDLKSQHPQPSIRRSRELFLKLHSVRNLRVSGVCLASAPNC